MKLKPLRFIGHKIGPFDHIELNWEKESRHTLIIAENGMGKTTLVTAIAACLSLGNKQHFPPEAFQRFAHNQESFAYFSFEYNGEVFWSFSCPLSNNDKNTETIFEDFLHFADRITSEGIFVDENMARGDARRLPARMIHSHNWLQLKDSWKPQQNVKVMFAAYGVQRDLRQPEIQEQIELDNNSLADILNPFASIPSTEVFQWVVNQHINYALALTDNKREEAEAYLKAIRRMEKLWQDLLEQPIKFQVKRNPFRLEVQQNGATLAVEQLSDGTRSFLSWSLDYLMRASRVNWEKPTDSVVAPGLVLVDEIDSHLHPEWQRRVMSVVSQLLPETYVIAPTHSPFVVGSVDDAQVFQIYRDDNGKLNVKARYDELYGYPADLVLQKAFVPSLYPPEMEQKLERLSDLANKVAAGTLSKKEKREHDSLLAELSRVNPWLNTLMALSQTGKSAT